MDQEGQRRRTFVALALGDEARRLAAETIERLRERLRDPAALRFVATVDLHVTLAFLGELDEDAQASVRDVVARVAAAHPRMQVVMGGLGAFPRVSQARVLWLAFGSGDAPLSRMVADLTARLRDAGHALEDRDWTGHVTLARSRRWRGIDARALVEGDAGRRVACPVDALAVMESGPTRTDERYAVIFRAELSK